MHEMKNVSILTLALLPLLVICVEKKPHIIFLRNGEGQDKASAGDTEKFHFSHLRSVKSSDRDTALSLLYSYNHIHGYAALLSRAEVHSLSHFQDVIAVVPSRSRSVQTTRSWDFLQLNTPLTGRTGSLPELENFGEDIIIGVVDTGIWPESESFNDSDMGPVPERWKGRCETGEELNTSNCNRKIIGARYFMEGFSVKYTNTVDHYVNSTRDGDGHGTNSASIVAGKKVHGISSLGGFANGTVAGGAPLAHLSIYKSCYTLRPLHAMCTDVDVVAAVNAAIEDKVDVLLISVASNGIIPYDQDGLVISTLHAVKKNITVICPAGNSGPDPKTVGNTAPWIITVAATTIDRTFDALISLGDGTSVIGQSITPILLKDQHPLIYAANVAVDGASDARFCTPNSLSAIDSNGSIIFCDRGVVSLYEKSLEVLRVNGAGCIIGNRPLGGNDMYLVTLFQAATSVDAHTALSILEYINSTVDSTATLHPASTVIGKVTAPSMSVYSSRGPSVLNLNILKPDIAAPGVNILAAWTGGNSLSGHPKDHILANWRMVTGTSTSAAHVTGIVALIKKKYPDWSPAAIKSAIMTTATVTNNKGSAITDQLGDPATPFSLGSGMIEPKNASNPGLIYDISIEDYIIHMCSIGISLDFEIKCGKVDKPTALNYPSLSITHLKEEVTVNRTVTNVGEAPSQYQSFFVAPNGISINIVPSALSFEYVGEKKTFTILVKLIGNDTTTNNETQHLFGTYGWKNDLHIVKSPVVVSLA